MLKKQGRQLPDGEICINCAGNKKYGIFFGKNEL